MVAPRRIGFRLHPADAVGRCAWRWQWNPGAVLLAVLAAPVVQAQAQVAGGEAGAGPWSGAIGLVSDKVVRGLSQTGGRATVFADLNYRSDTGWAAGLGLSPLRVGGEAIDSGNAEVTLSVGRGWQLDADWAVQFGFAHYAYPGRGRRSPEYNYDELSASVGWQGRVFASVAVSPETYGWDSTRTLRRGRATNVELSAHQRLAGRLSLDAGIGYYDLSAVRGTGYRYGSIGLGWGVGAFQADLTRIASNAARRGLAAPEAAGGRWVASVLWNF